MIKKRHIDFKVAFAMTLLFCSVVLGLFHYVIGLSGINLLYASLFFVLLSLFIVIITE